MNQDILKEKQSPKAIAIGEVSAEAANFHEMNGLPKLLNLRHVSNSNGGKFKFNCTLANLDFLFLFLLPGTPCNKQNPSDAAEDWTPFSSVSAIDESVFDRSCVSLMEDLSQSTISTPIRDLRQQMVSLGLPSIGNT